MKKKQFEIDFMELENLKKLTSNTRTTSILTQENVESIIEKIKEKKDVSDTIALALITGIMQNGGSNKNAGQAVSFSIEDKTLSAQELQSYIKSIKSTSTNRQLARALADEIGQIAYSLGLEGDLSNQMRYDHPDLTFEDAVWCSNFQTTNQNCPEIVRDWLVYNYKSLSLIHI